MNKLKAFVRLDFVTVKSYFTLKTMLLYGAVALFLSMDSQNLSSAMGVGAMLSTLFIGYPFALGEKSNMDALYVTLSLERKTVVLGRYLFALALNLCTLLLSVALASLGMIAKTVFANGPALSGSYEGALVLSGVFVFIQSIQLPMYFKLGYSKAKILTMVPFVAMMVGYVVITEIADVGGLFGIIASVLCGTWAVPLCIAMLLAVVMISYRLSLVFYEKREF